MKTKKSLISTISLSLLCCSLSLMILFKPICTKTISNSFLNKAIVNQVIDFTIDNYQNLKQSQLKNLQNDLLNCQELTTFSQEIFAQTIKSIERQTELKIKQKDTKVLVIACKKYFKQDLKQTLKQNKQQELSRLLLKITSWSRFLTNVNHKMTKDSFFMVFYKLADNILLKVLLLLLIIINLLYLLKITKKLMIVYLLITALFISFFHYLLLLGIKIIKPFLIAKLTITSLDIYTKPLLLVATCFLLTSILLFIFSIFLKNSSKS